MTPPQPRPNTNPESRFGLTRSLLVLPVFLVFSLISIPLLTVAVTLIQA